MRCITCGYRCSKECGKIVAVQFNGSMQYRKEKDRRCVYDKSDKKNIR
ncbi:hypothetical protein ACTQ6A_13900 [Lachnospiraceae bacterium LCP25S3_G4]